MEINQHGRSCNIPEDRTNQINKNQNFFFEIKYHVDVNLPIKSYAGNNRLYNTRKYTFYYLIDTITWTIHTNNILFKAANIRPYKVKSNCAIPNDKFKISKILTDIMCKQKSIPSRIRKKYFYRIRNLVFNKLKVIRSRENQQTNKNRKTKTYIRFSYKRKQMYFGIYRPCHCKLPAPYVMSNH